MPETGKIVELYDGQVTLKFYKGKHQYFRMHNTEDISYNNLPSDEVMIVPASDVGQYIKVPSTTTITKSCLDKPFLYNWLVDISVNEYTRCMKEGIDIDKAIGLAKGARWKALKKGGDIGNAVHGFAEKFTRYMLDEGPMPEEITSPKEVKNGILGFLDWYEENVKEPLRAEYLVYNPELDTAGTLDFVFINKDGNLELSDFKTGSNIYPGDVMQIAFYRKTYALQEQEFPHVASIVHLQKDKPKAIPYRTLDHDAAMIAFECGRYLVNWNNTLKI